MEGNTTYTDQELIILLKKGNQIAFRLIYDEYRAKIYSVSLKMVGYPELAEEIVQEVMLKLWQVAQKLTDDTTIDAYLKTLTRNRSYNVLRRMAVEARANKERAVDYDEYHNDTEEQIILSDTRRVLHDGIDLLPLQQKIVYQLCHKEGLKYEEAAQRLNLSPFTVATHMKLALRFLRKYISRNTDVLVVFVLFDLMEK